MDTSNRIEDLVSCPRCQSSSDPIERPCLWCDGSGETTELHATEYEVAQLERRLRLATDELTKIRAEVSYLRPIRTAARWQQWGRPDHGLDKALDRADEEESKLKQHLDAADRATAAWISCMAKKGAA